MKSSNKKAILAFFFTSLVACFGIACEQPKTGGNSTATINSTLNSNSDSMNANSSGNSAVVRGENNQIIDTKEPEQYQATVLLKLETSGAQQMPLPPLKADVARSGGERRMEFKLPTGETIVYLDKGGKQFIIQPQKKQYAELNKESVGVDVRRLMMPEQIVNQLKTLKNVERVGEDNIDGRDAVKYRIASTTNTQSQAGRVDTESFILVDKETGLPLRSFTNAASQNGSVQGVNSVNLVTEMNNIRTNVDAAIFSEPTDFRKVAPEEVRAQINVIFGAASAIFGQLMKSNQPTSNNSAGNNNNNGNNQMPTPTP
jgi:hypothetical protein